MELEFVPLLQLQRDLYGQPVGRERFDNYIKEMVDPHTRDLQLPLVAMNPMGKDHLPALLDQYLALGVDQLAAEWTAEAQTQLTAVSGTFKVALVIADDAQGKWTNRYATEFGHRFESKPLFRRGWLTGLLWSSEDPHVQTVREETLTTIYRGAYIAQHGFACTLDQMMSQEGWAMAQAGCVAPQLDEDELAYTREVLAPHRSSEAYPTLMVGLFGDEAAHALGHPALGLSPRAGFALARHEAQA